MGIKNFKNFLNEADNPLDPDYLSDIERRAREEHEENFRDGRINPNIMQLVMQVQQIQNQGDNKERLRDLAERVIRNEYDSILHGVDLNMRIVDGWDDQLSGMKDKVEIDAVEIDTEDIQDEIDKRKIINNITQGAAKNTHRLIHSEMSAQGLSEIDPNLLDLFDRLIKTSEFIEWQIPKEEGARMMKENPNGMSNVEWDDEDQMEDFERSAEDIINDIENEESQGEYDFSSGGPTVNALGIDYVVLLHEAVKGIYELISQVAIPEERPEDVLAATDTTSDEYDDLKYGMYIRRDLITFITQNDKIMEIENGVEYVFGGVQPDIKGLYDVPAGEFKELIMGMIRGTDEARKIVDEIIDNVVDYIKSWEADQALGEDPLEDTDVNDYSKMSYHDLKREMDKALDNNDFDLAREIGKYLN